MINFPLSTYGFWQWKPNICRQRTVSAAAARRRCERIAAEINTPIVRPCAHIRACTSWKKHRWMADVILKRKDATPFAQTFDVYWKTCQEGQGNRDVITQLFLEIIVPETAMPVAQLPTTILHLCLSAKSPTWLHTPRDGRWSCCFKFSGFLFSFIITAPVIAGRPIRQHSYSMKRPAIVPLAPIIFQTASLCLDS